jgi:hypothetical protein
MEVWDIFWRYSLFSVSVRFFSQGEKSYLADLTDYPGKTPRV